jgi:colanic acid biosynthesis glycosyl transferase WcaI
MNILFLSSAYGKGGAATNQHWTELCEHLAATHCVTVLTAAWHVAAPASREENGVQICSIGSWVLPKIKNRHLWEAVLWLLLCAKILGMNAGFDLVICVDTPRFSTLIGWFYKIRFRSQVLAWVKDIPLEQVVRRSQNKLAVFCASVCNHFSSRSLFLADRVVPIGECMARVLKSYGVPERKLCVIGDWAHDHALVPLLPSVSRKEAGIPDLFTIMYLGFAATWHDFDSIIQAIPKLVSMYPVQFLFIGNGPGIDRVAEAKVTEGWENVIVRGWVPREELLKLPMCGDIHIASLKQNMLGTCSPSKTYTSMAFGRSSIFIGPEECQAAKDILEANAGRVVENADELVAAIEDFLSNPEKLETCSRNARKAFLEKHCAQAVFKKWDELIEGLVH